MYNNTCLEHYTAGDVMKNRSVQRCHLKVKCNISDVLGHLSDYTEKAQEAVHKLYASCCGIGVVNV